MSDEFQISQRVADTNRAAAICGYPPVPTPKHTVKRLPGRIGAGVYFLWRESEVVYVGMSLLSIPMRLLRNHKVRKWDDLVSWIEIVDPQQTWITEAFYVGCLRPALNHRDAKLGRGPARTMRDEAYGSRSHVSKAVPCS